MPLPPLDLIIENADVVTLDPERPQANRIGVLHGRIVGLDEDLDGWPATEVFDAAGATVLPGLIDAHTHLQLTGQGLKAVRIDDCHSAQSALDQIAEAATSAGPDDWIEVYGYDQLRIGRHLDAVELHKAGGGRRVWVKHWSAHASVVSTAVLERAGHGPANGLLHELEQELVGAQRLPYSQTELADAIEQAARQAAAQGITTCVDAGAGGVVGSLSPADGAAFQVLVDAGRLPVRVRLMPSMDVLHQVSVHQEDGFGRGLPLGLRTGFGGEMLGLSAQKVVLDGGMSVGTARMTRPMTGLDSPGVWRDDPDQMREAIADGHVAGWQMAVHAIGDAALDLALDAIAEGQRRSPRPDARHRIEHGGAIRPDQLPRLAALGLTVVSQASFLYDYGDHYTELLGPDRADWLYRGRSLLDAGVRVVGSTDRPLPGTPLRAIQSWAERTTNSGVVLSDDVLSVRQALEAFTVHAAWLLRAEHELGRVRRGYRADLTVLGGNPLTTPIPEIAALEIRNTVLGGRIVAF
ncbi:amidohydrolase [Kineosporia babensis]|uniref:Amidohydrolase family protein n=1 Tax=Kineosporia babensis TaxID=499548 RepID=A0A9X1NKK7_9ACTN|nr:amidohydrolase family protein [Kineosporia babensis]MCD5314823.1 amidohydrolase family protein [Kineosporia babensis]